MSQRPNIALYEPDIPQNTAAIIRTCACLGAKLEIIEPCGGAPRSELVQSAIALWWRLSAQGLGPAPNPAGHAGAKQLGQAACSGSASAAAAPVLASSGQPGGGLA